jgi:hypothetical protein
VSGNPELEAIETVGGVMTDLVEIAERLPVRPDQAERVARMLDRLSEEIAEAAGMLRAAGAADRESKRGMHTS